MSTSNATGLGEPEVVGKKSLFQPPLKKTFVTNVAPKRVGETTPRLRITTDLTQKAMEIVQDLQHKHRLKTGKSLPAWKIVSQALELYGKQGEEQRDKTRA